MTIYGCGLDSSDLFSGLNCVILLGTALLIWWYTKETKKLRIEASKLLRPYGRSISPVQALLVLCHFLLKMIQEATTSHSLTAGVLRRTK